MVLYIALLLSQLAEEMFLVLGQRFDTYDALVKSITGVQERWVRRLGPAILDYTEELEMPPPSDDEPDSRCNLHVYTCESNCMQCMLLTRISSILSTVQLQKIAYIYVAFFVAALSLYCLESLVRILKSKGGKPSFEERLSAIVVFAKVRQAACCYE